MAQFGRLQRRMFAAHVGVLRSANAATSYVIRQRRARPQMLVSLDEVEALPIEAETERKVALNQLTALIQRLKPVDRQVIWPGSTAWTRPRLANSPGFRPEM